MRALCSFVLLLVLVCGTWGGCRRGDWRSVLDRTYVWASCRGNEYIKGLWRNARTRGRDVLCRIDFANCCTAPEPYGSQNGVCVNANWASLLNRKNVWAFCPSGRYLQGIYKSKRQWVSNIEQGRCCKPPGHPDTWGECYVHDVSASFNKKGWSNCKEGYRMVGFFKGACNEINCIERFKCCKIQPARAKKPQACTEGKKFKNECGDECACDAKGGAINCTRIRKEFTTMTADEQKRYITTAKKIATDPRFKPAYDDLIYTHRILFPSIIHTRDMFLPWHRYFLLQYENLLRQADCRVNAIYWDWSLVADDPWRGKPGDVWYAGDRGLGGNGKCQGGENAPCCVRDGVLAEDKFRLVSGSATECLKRNFDSKLVKNTTTVQALLKERDFEKFEKKWRDYHNHIHMAIGGTMATDDSASAPEFFFHHGFVDKFWDDWQAKSDANKHAHFWKVHQLMPRQGIWPWQAIDLINMPGFPSNIRVKYAAPPTKPRADDAALAKSEEDDKSWEQAMRSK